MIRKASKKDAVTIAGLAALMWDGHSVEELTDDFAALLSRDDARIFL